MPGPDAAVPPIENVNFGKVSRKIARNTLWLNDFSWKDGHLLIRKTGIRLAITTALLNEIANWAMYLAILSVAVVRARLVAAPRVKIWFAPDRPRPWYLIRGAAMWAGFDLAKHPTEAQAAFYFDDSTIGQSPPGMTARRFNFNCIDISKSYVAQIFEEVFGYALTVDPRLASGDIVEKPEKNGVHGGRIVMAPLEPRPGFTYQRVVDTQDENGCCHDLRTPCAGGIPVVVWIKTKTPEGRFSINNRRAALAEPAETYSADELVKIAEFTSRMGLDWGGLDILRDRNDGRIYIVDVNKTDLGPVIALSWRNKIRSMDKLAAAFRHLVEMPPVVQRFQ